MKFTNKNAGFVFYSWLFKYFLRAIDINPTSNYILTGGFDKNISIYDLDDQKIQTKINIHTNKVVNVKWHPFFPIFASSSADRTVRLFASEKFCNKYKM